MSKKQLVLLLIALVAFGAYVHYFTDWFASETIQIAHTFRPAPATKRARNRVANPIPSGLGVSFALDRKCRITELKVIPVADLETNKYAHPIWHLISESNSVPVKGFAYGMRIQGMRPTVSGASADSLEPNVLYRLFLKTDNLSGEHDFKMIERPAARR